MEEKLDLLKKLSDFDKKDKKEKKNYKNIFLLFMILSMLFFVYQIKSDVINLTKKDRALQIQASEQIGLLENLEDNEWEEFVASGYIVPKNTASVSSEISGRIEKIYVEEGDYIEKGCLIAKLNTSLAEIEKNAAVAKLDSIKLETNVANARLKKAKFINNANIRLYQVELISKEEYIKSQLDVEELTAVLHQAENNIIVNELEMQRKNAFLEKHYLRAPCSGIIVNKNMQEGEIIFPASEGVKFDKKGVVKIMGLKSLDIEVEIDESQINKLFIGQAVRAGVDFSQDFNLSGILSRINPNINREKGTVKIKIKLKEINQKLLPNMAVKVKFLPKENKSGKKNVA